MVQNNKFSTVFIGHPLIILQCVDSTNTFLKNALAKFEPYTHGTVIMAVEQFAGRGQQNNLWQSKSGENLTFSILYQPDNLLLTHQFELNKAVSLAVADVLTDWLPHEKVEIKWPNDVLVNQKKICGILIENILQGKKIKNSIIGIGLNVNQTVFGDDIEPKVTSIRKISGAEVALIKLLEQLSIKLETRLSQVSEPSKQKLHNDYLSYLYQYQKEAGYKHNGNFFVGKIHNVNIDGKLIVATETGEVSFATKEIEFIG